MLRSYKLLKLDPTATVDQVRRAYRAQAIEYHPDKGGDGVMFNRIHNAYKDIMSTVFSARHVTEADALEMVTAKKQTRPVVPVGPTKKYDEDEFRRDFDRHYVPSDAEAYGYDFKAPKKRLSELQVIRHENGLPALNSSDCVTSFDPSAPADYSTGQLTDLRHAYAREDDDGAIARAIAQGPSKARCRVDMKKVEAMASARRAEIEYPDDARIDEMRARDENLRRMQESAAAERARDRLAQLRDIQSRMTKFIAPPNDG
jgi:hypothetical protein